MKIKTIILVMLTVLSLTNCNNDNDLIELTDSLTNTTWIGVETYNCSLE
jgi:hypothetical protein